MIYNLNFNYGKVAVTGNEKRFVAVYDNLGKMQHLVFAGSVDIAETTTGCVSSFFGSSGYKVSEDDSWTFCKGLLVCYVENNSCYAVTDNNNPIDCTSSHALYDSLTRLIAMGKVVPPSNVYKL